MYSAMDALPGAAALLGTVLIERSQRKTIPCGLTGFLTQNRAHGLDNRLVIARGGGGRNG